MKYDTDVASMMIPSTKKQAEALKYLGLIKDKQKKLQKKEKVIKKDAGIQILSDKQSIREIESMHSELHRLLVEGNKNNKIIKLMREELESRQNPETTSLQIEIEDLKARLKLQTQKSSIETDPHSLAKLRLYKNTLMERIVSQEDSISSKQSLLNSLSLPPKPSFSFSKPKGNKNKTKPQKTVVVPNVHDAWTLFPSNVRDTIVRNHDEIKANEAKIAQLQAMVQRDVYEEVHEKVSEELSKKKSLFDKESWDNIKNSLKSVGGIYDAEIKELNEKICDLQQKKKIYILKKMKSI